jgi:hypothetical protein
MGWGRDKFLADSPFKCTDHVPDPFVNLIPAKAGVDHFVTNCFEAKRTKLRGHRVPVKFANGSESQPDIDRLRGSQAILDVIRVGVFKVRQEHLVDGEIVWRNGCVPIGLTGKTAAVRQPICNRLVILQPALWRSEPATVDISPVQPDDALV